VESTFHLIDWRALSVYGNASGARVHQCQLVIVPRVSVESRPVGDIYGSVAEIKFQGRLI